MFFGAKQNAFGMRTAFRNVLRSAFFAADSCFICGDPHGVSERLSTASTQEFLFFVYDRLPALQKMLLLALPFSQRQGFFLAPAAAVQRERFLRPAEKAMQLSTLQCDSFRVFKNL